MDQGVELTGAPAEVLLQEPLVGEKTVDVLSLQVVSKARLAISTPPSG